MKSKFTVIYFCAPWKSKWNVQGMKSRFKYCIAAETKSIMKKKCIEIYSIIGK